MEILCQVQNSDWGKKGSASTVARLAEDNKGLAVCQEVAYAELWMGTHPTHPCLVKADGTDLGTFLQQNPHLLGPTLQEGQLSFLFKVLSIAKALSVQAHPTKTHAEQLHAKFPDIYKDSNHKPELAVALTEFEALCGFRPAAQIQFFLKTIPELQLLVEEENWQAFCTEATTDGLKKCFANLMNASPDLVRAALGQLETRLRALPESERGVFEAELVEKLSRQFPGDVGVFCVYWLNHVTLAPCQALYLGPNEPHAYISGDCVECMANSDNVVRAGLTPKFRDVATLCEMLTYQHHRPEDILFAATAVDGNTRLWSPPVPDFAVAMTRVSAGHDYTLPPRQVAFILLCVGGRGALNSRPVGHGSILFVAANETCRVHADHDILLFHAFCNL